MKGELNIKETAFKFTSYFLRFSAFISKKLDRPNSIGFFKKSSQRKQFVHLHVVVMKQTDRYSKLVFKNRMQNGFVFDQ